MGGSIVFASCANVHPIYTCFLGSIPQTASESVYLFLHSSLQKVPVLYNGPLLSHRNCPFACGDLDPHLTHGSLDQPSPQPKRHLDRFSRFCTAHDRDRQTDRRRDHATPSVTVCRIYVDLRSTAMRPNKRRVRDLLSILQRQHQMARDII